MKATVTLLLFSAVVACAVAFPGKGSTKPNRKECLKDCGEVFKPICAGSGNDPKSKDNKSFGSECVLSNYNCENQPKMSKISEGECPGSKGIRLS